MLYKDGAREKELRKEKKHGLPEFEIIDLAEEEDRESLMVALVIIPNVPSDPIQRSRKLIPLTNFLKGAPHFTFSPVGRNPSRAYT